MNFRGSGAGEKGDPGPVGIKGERGASAPSLPAEPIGKKLPVNMIKISKYFISEFQLNISFSSSNTQFYESRISISPI